MKKQIALATAVLFAQNTWAATISGTVTNADGQPVKGALVELLGSAVSVKTRADGRFTLESGKIEDVELHVTASGYTHADVHLSTNNPSPVQVALKRSVIEQIDVIGSPLHGSVLESATPINVLAEDELRMKQASTIGETLKSEVGIHASYFGPVSSSPIIRGLDGPRVMITQNSLDSSDASRVGPDHIVASEAATARQIEVLRGPATLIYGSGAIGGVVNVVDDRVPTSNLTEGDWQLSRNTVADEDQAAFSLTTGTGNVAVHVDGFWRDGDDYKIPGAAELASDHDEHEEHEHEEEGHDEHEEEGHDEHAENSGVLENSAAKATGFNVGASYLLDNGYVGFSYGRLARTYGIPGHSHGEEEHDEHEEEAGAHEEESVQGDLEQDRWQILSELSLDNAWLSGINTRLGYTDYTHAEIENGAVGTVFNNETFQGRVDLQLQERAGWRSTVSMEYKNTDFEAIGEEAFTPPSETDLYGLAVMGEKHFDDVLLQWGARIERVEISATPGEIEFGGDEHPMEAAAGFADQDFSPVNLSLGAVWDFTPGYNLAISFTHAQRAPSSAELFAFGPHIGTGTFEVGALYQVHDEGNGEFHLDLRNDDPSLEKSNNIDLSLRKFEGDVGFIVNLFYNQVENFIYQQNTNLTNDGLHSHEEHDEHEEEGHEHEEEGHEHAEATGLPVLVFQQADAKLYGLEAEFIWQATPTLKATLMTDYIRGKLDDGGNLPRIPPMRLGTVFNYQKDAWAAELSAIHHFEQDDIGELETSTDSYTMVDANVSYLLDLGENEVTAYFKVNNLTDTEGRVHSSFLKNRTLLPGRGVVMGIRGSF